MIKCMFLRVMFRYTNKQWTTELKMGEDKTVGKRKEKPAGISFNYTFDHPLSMLEINNVLKELLKYTMFWRYQIPYTYLSLKAEYDAEMSKGPSTKRRTKIVKLKSDFVENFENILRDLDEILKRDVLQIVLIFGSTVISPKETVLIELDDYSSKCPQIDDEDVTVRKAVRRTCQQFLRRVVVGEDFQRTAELRPTKVHVLFSGTRGSFSDFRSGVFVPKLNFRLSSRGLLHRLDLKVVGNLTASPSTVINEEEISLSPDTKLSSGMESLQLESNEEELVWFMANTQLKGFVEPCSKTSSDSIDWMR